MKTIVLTGFGLWGEENYNSSWDILCDNTLALPPGWQSRIHGLPVSWERVPHEIDELLAAPDVRALICFGMCGGRTVKVERIAINLNDSHREDADRARARSEFVVPGGPPAYWTGLPMPTTVHALKTAGVPAAESRDAGGFLCNFAFYHLMHRIASREHRAVGGFVHVPHFETEGGLPAESLRLAVPIVASEAMKLADAPVLELH